MWQMETAMKGGAKLGGCAVGDFEPGSEGEEIAVVASTGEVFLLARDSEAWSRKLLFQAPGEMIQCAAGDFLPEHAGDELVFVGRSSGEEDTGAGGAAYIAWNQEGSWRFDLLLEQDELFHAVALGDLDPAAPGIEILLSGFCRELHLVRQTEQGRQVETIANLPGPAKGVSVAEERAVVACNDGSLVEVVPVVRDKGSQASFEARVLLRSDAPLARVHVAEEGVLFCGNDGKLRLWREGQSESLLRAPDRLRGAAIAEVDPARPGREFLSAGYDGRVWVVHRTKKGEWVATAAAEDDDRLHHVAAGRIGPALQADGLPFAPGRGENAIVACGYSGRVLVVRRIPR